MFLTIMGVCLSQYRIHSMDELATNILNHTYSAIDIINIRKSQDNAKYVGTNYCV